MLIRRRSKPPDGVHHVDEIRKLRGGITRRQPKASLKAGANINTSGWRQGSAESTPSTAPASKRHVRAESHKVVEESPVTSPVNIKDGQKLHTSFNTANWQATGVINNLPPRAPSRSSHHGHSTQAQRIQDMRHDATGSKFTRPEYDGESVPKLQEDAEVGRAAELALREVLSSLEAAKRRVEPRPLFDDVEVFALAFPGLCLAILPAPSTLFTPTPFPGADTWTLTPPGKAQYEALNGALNRRYRERRQEGGLESLPDSVAFRYSAHLSGAWEHWQTLGEQDKASAWSLEILRAFSKSQDARQRAKKELEAAQHRIRHLEAEYDRLSKCQLPREYLLHPPNTTPATSLLVKELDNSHSRTIAAEAGYDADALLTKWRTTIRATTRRPPPPPPHRAVPNDIYEPGSSESQMRGDIIMNGAVLGVNGPMPRGDDTRAHDPSVNYETPPNSGVVVGAEEEDELDADAEGEIEDSGSFLSYTNRNSLVRLRRSGAGSNPRMSSESALNGNGKRPYEPTPASGRTRGSKVLKERFACGDAMGQMSGGR